MASSPLQTELSRTILRYEPVIGRSRRAVAIRIIARSPDQTPVNLSRLYAELAESWPATAGVVILRVLGANISIDLVKAQPSWRVWVEVPIEQIANSSGVELVAALKRRRFNLALNGNLQEELPFKIQRAFRMVMFDAGPDPQPMIIRRPQPGVPRLRYAHIGLSTIAQLEKSFEAGAVAAVGWPFDDSDEHAESSKSNPDFSTITELLSMLSREADPGDIEDVLRKDVALSYRMLRYINSASFGLRTPVQSFRHAVMLLGYEKMKRWLTLMLTTASKDANMQPLMFASLRRGLFLESLLAADADPALRDEAFIMGVMSLLDKLFQESMSELVEKLNFSENVQDALVSRSGPLAPYLAVAEAVERDPDNAMNDLLEWVLVPLGQCNKALLKAITLRIRGT